MTFLPLLFHHQLIIGLHGLLYERLIVQFDLFTVLLKDIIEARQVFILVVIKTDAVSDQRIEIALVVAVIKANVPEAVEEFSGL